MNPQPHVLKPLIFQGLRGQYTLPCPHVAHIRVDEQPVHALRHRVQVVVEQVRVHVQGHGRRRVPELPLDGLDVRAAPDHEAGGGVSQVVDGHARHAGRVALAREPTGPGLGRIDLHDIAGRTGRIREQQIIVPLAAYRQQRAEHGREHDGAQFVGLRRADDDPPAHFGGALVDVEPAPVEVHVADGQPGSLAPPQAGQPERQHEHTVWAARVREGEQLRCSEVGVSGAPWFAGQADAARGIMRDEVVGHGVVEDPGEDAIRPEDDARALRLAIDAPVCHVADPLLHAGTRDLADTDVRPIRGHVLAVRALQIVKIAGFRVHLLLRDPRGPQVAYGALRARRVHVGAFGDGDGHVVGLPQLGVLLAFEAPAVGLRAVGLPVSDAVAEFAASRSVGGYRHLGPVV